MLDTDDLALDLGAATPSGLAGKGRPRVDGANEVEGSKGYSAPPVTDPGKELMTAAAEGAVTGFLETLFGPVAEAGQLLRDLVRERRWRVQVKILRRVDGVP